METDNKIIEAENTQPAVTPATTNAEPETQEQINWKKFREAREVERKQRIEAEKKAKEKEAEAEALKAAMEALLNRQNPNVPNSQDNDQYGEEGPSQEQIIAQMVKVEMEKERALERERSRQEELQKFPEKLNSNFKDFNQVCTSDNLDYLEYHYPEVAEPFKNLPDGYDKWAAIYRAVKRFVPNTDSSKDRAKAEKNFSKPQAMSIAGKTQVGDTAPQQLDEKRRADNWSRMQRVMKGGK